MVPELAHPAERAGITAGKGAATGDYRRERQDDDEADTRGDSRHFDSNPQITERTGVEADCQANRLLSVGAVDLDR